MIKNLRSYVKENITENINSDYYWEEFDNIVLDYISSMGEFTDDDMQFLFENNLSPEDFKLRSDKMRINKINKYVSTFETKKERFIFYKYDLAAVIFKDKFKIYTTEEFYKRSTVKDQLENIKGKLIIINDLSVII